MTQVELEEPKEGWVEWFLNRSGGKAEQHQYLTSMLAQHQELWRTPHQQKMYSEAYKNINKAGKLYCSEIFMLKWRHTMGASTNHDNFDATKMSPDMYQHFANEQAAAQECLSESLNLYFDSFQTLASRYDVCKQECLANNT